MYKTIRASELWAFNTCQYKSKYEEFDYDPTKLFVGDIVHSAARHDHMLPVVEYYYEAVSGDFKMKQILMKMVNKVRLYALKRIAEAHTHWRQVYFEMKMIVIFREKKVILSWTPDLIIVKENEVEIVDFKTAKSRLYYEWDDIRWESMQPSVYGTMAMLYFKKDTAKFTYFVLEKTSSVPTIERSKAIENEKHTIEKLIDKRLIAQSTNIWETNRWRACWSCALKKAWTCPSWNARLTNVEYHTEGNDSDIEELAPLSIWELDV